LLQGRFKVIRDFGSDDVWRRQRVGVGQRLVFDPKEVKAELVALHQFCIVVTAPTTLGVCLTPGLRALVHAAGFVTVDKLVEILALDRLLLKREVLVGSQIIDSYFVGPRFGTALLLIEEDHVSLHAWRIPDAGGQAQQGVDAAFLKEVPSHLLARAALEQHVVRDHHRGMAVDFQKRVDVLHKIELLVARRSEAVKAVVNHQGNLVKSQNRLNRL